MEVYVIGRLLCLFFIRNYYSFLDRTLQECVLEELGQGQVFLPQSGTIKSGTTDEEGYKSSGADV